MLIISFLDPRRNLNPTVIGLTRLPREEELYTQISECLQKGNGAPIPLQLALPDGQELLLPNVYFAALTEEKDASRLVIPPFPS